jgi:hypothetical protein
MCKDCGGLTALNLANRRFLLDNSQTFGGTHYAEPRQIRAQVRYRFHFCGGGLTSDEQKKFTEALGNKIDFGK